ncbi:Cbb3-type cytochrome c oxidase subunit CcoP [bacterium HR40]|nr:Cbb3-type cytochrome c oxidase subunit CcoP [bacterium HR40]
MPTKIEKDAVTGTPTTGHEWDGIKELDTPLPKWWVYLFYATILWSVVWWVLYPSWPTLRDHTRGILGHDQRSALEQQLAAARAAQARWLERIAAADTAAIEADPELLAYAVRGGEAAFKDNCAPCHGLGGAGQLSYPSLADDDWLWGGSLGDIETTIRHGIRYASDPETRESRMPAFGAEGLLEPAQIGDVVQYVLSLSGRASDAEAAGRGQTIFVEQCAACHGEDGRGMRETGAPNLTDAIWLYGGEPEQIRAQIERPRHGVMPAWSGRLKDEVIKMVTVYVHNLGGGE